MTFKAQAMTQYAPFFRAQVVAKYADNISNLGAAESTVI
jgi:hypothetical protein